MERLIKDTTAYKIFSTDAVTNRLSHAYMLYLTDKFTLRDALKIFAVRFFNAENNARDKGLIEIEGLTDLMVFPTLDKKLSVENASAIVEDSALRPVEHNKKLYVISDFDTASPLFQNKLLKVIEEPPQGVYFLLGASSLSPVLDTIKSRVKTLEIPPFSPEKIRSALDRLGSNPLNKEVSESCSGSYGTAVNMLKGGWFSEVRTAATEICAVNGVGKISEVSAKYGDTKYKNELLSEMQRIYFNELRRYAEGETPTLAINKQACMFACESISKAIMDVKFNASFANLLYDFLLKVILENNKWKKSLV